MVGQETLQRLVGLPGRTGQARLAGLVDPADVASLARMADLVALTSQAGLARLADLAGWMRAMAGQSKVLQRAQLTRTRVGGVQKGFRQLGALCLHEPDRRVEVAVDPASVFKCLLLKVR